MNRVLIYGLKDPVGGVERVVIEYVKSMTIKFDITFDFLVFSEGFSLQKEISDMGCRVITLPVRRKDPKNYKMALTQLFRDNTYCAVWGNFSGLTNIDVLVLSKQYEVPVRIAHSHVSRLYWGSPIMKYVVKILHRYNKLRLRRYANRFLACSEVARDFMFPKQCWNQTIFIRNAVDTTRFYPDPNCKLAMREKLGIPSQTLVVGHVARMCEVKNQGFLLKVVSTLVASEHDVTLLLVGDGELREVLEKLTDELGITNNVIFTGLRRDIPDLLRAMDVYVLTSFSEGLSVSAVEAQACGLPCVLSAAVSTETDISGAVEFVSLDSPLDVWEKAITTMGKRGIRGMPNGSSGIRNPCLPRWWR